MSNGQFEVDDEDIVKFVPDDADAGSSAWVNIGTHAVFIELTSDGNLRVKVNARCNEGADLAVCSVSKKASVEAGGINPDDDDDDDEDFGEAPRDGVAP